MARHVHPGRARGGHRGPDLGWRLKGPRARGNAVPHPLAAPREGVAGPRDGPPGGPPRSGHRRPPTPPPGGRAAIAGEPRAAPGRLRPPAEVVLREAPLTVTGMAGPQGAIRP